MSFVIAITGPTGSGKSTVAARLAKDAEKCVNIDADAVKHFIASGFVYDETPAGVAQWKLLGLNIGQLAKNFHESGYSVVINGYINEPAWENIQTLIKIDNKFLLLPKVETSIERDKGRSAEIAMGADAVHTHTIYFTTNPYYSDYAKIDNTQHSIDQTVAVIIDALRTNNDLV